MSDDDALDALLERYVPGSMLGSMGTASLIEHARRLRTERNEWKRRLGLASEECDRLGGRVDHERHRAEVAEKARDDAHGWAAHCNARAQASLERAEAAERSRDQAVEDARFLSECAAKLLHGGDALIEDVVESVHDEWQRQLRRMFDPLRLSDVMSRYADAEPVTAQEHDGAEVANG